MTTVIFLRLYCAVTERQLDIIIAEDPDTCDTFSLHMQLAYFSKYEQIQSIIFEHSLPEPLPR